MRAVLFIFATLAVFLQLLASTAAAPFIVGITYDLSRKNFLVAVDPATGMVG